MRVGWRRQMVRGRDEWFLCGAEGGGGQVVELKSVDGAVEWLKLSPPVATIACKGGVGRLALYRWVWRQKTKPRS